MMPRDRVFWTAMAALLPLTAFVAGAFINIHGKSPGVPLAVIAAGG